MQIIGVGVGRTGTTSIEEALALLGYTTYNMHKLIQRNDFDQWLKIFRGKDDAPSWDDVYQGFDATIGWPSCFYYEDFLEKYPNAKFILTTRNAESWAKSFSMALGVKDSLNALKFIPRVRGLLSVLDEGILPHLSGTSRQVDEIITAFEAHNAKVIATIPAEKLLVYEASQGWEPLCEFIGVSVPDVPFPHANRGENFAETVRKSLGLKL